MTARQFGAFLAAFLMASGALAWLLIVGALVWGLALYYWPWTG